jgi:hypothetical protein
MKSSCIVNQVSLLQMANVSGTICVPTVRLLSFVNRLMWLMAQEDFINFSHHKSFRSYKNQHTHSTLASGFHLKTLQCYMPCPSHPPCHDHYNYIAVEVQVMNLFTTVFFSLLFHATWVQIFSSAPFLKHPQSVKKTIFWDIRLRRNSHGSAQPTNSVTALAPDSCQYD